MATSCSRVRAGRCGWGVRSERRPRASFVAQTSIPPLQVRGLLGSKPRARQPGAFGPNTGGMIKVAKIPPGVGPRNPQVLTLFGATGDLAQRKLWPGLYHLISAGFIPAIRIIGMSLDKMDV